MFKRVLVLLIVVAGLLAFNATAFAYLYGIDLSHHQTVSSWSQIAGAKNFVIVKATEGVGYTDPSFSSFRSGARSVGMYRGWYHFARPDLGNTGTAEANYFLSQATLQTGEALMLDFESEIHTNRVAWCKEFLDRCYAVTGMKPYIYLNWGNYATYAYDWSSIANAGYPLWRANPDGNSNPTVGVSGTVFGSNVPIKQYSWSGTCPGVSGGDLPVDLDSFNGDANTWLSHGYNYNPFGTAMAGSNGMVGNDTDGRYELFERAADGSVQHLYVQTNGAWSSWINEGGAILGNPFVARAGDGRLFVFGRATDRTIVYKHQTTAGGTFESTWRNLAGYCPSDPAVIANADGRLVCYVVGVDGNLYERCQTSPGSDTWTTSGGSGWILDGGSPLNSSYPPGVVRTDDGRIMIFCVATDGTLRVVAQTAANGSLGAWVNLGGGVMGRPAPCKNADGRVEVYIRGTPSLHTYSRCQTTPGGGSWTAWTDWGGTCMVDPVVYRNPNGQMVMWTVGPDNQLYQSYQPAPNQAMVGWYSLGGSWTYRKDIAAGIHASGIAEIWMIGSDHSPYHDYEDLHTGWSGWYVMGSPIF